MAISEVVFMASRILGLDLGTTGSFELPSDFLMYFGYFEHKGDSEMLVPGFWNEL
jgi:hypothetical protein